MDVRRAQSLTEGLDLLSREPFDCVLLDLGLPDASGLSALERLRDAAPHVAHLVLTGDRDDQRGIDAVAAGAQDYLVKGSVDGDGLRRAILYAVERRQADSVRERLRAAEILAEEATRLERGLLPVPILNDGALLVGTGYRPGRERTLLGGDFYDLVHTRDGAVHLDDRRCQRPWRRRGGAGRLPARGVEDADAGRRGRRPGARPRCRTCSSMSATPRRSSPRSRRWPSRRIV